MSTLPLAVKGVVTTCTVSTNDDGLLRTSSGCTIPTSSSTLYSALWKFTIISVQEKESKPDLLLKTTISIINKW